MYDTSLVVNIDTVRAELYTANSDRAVAVIGGGVVEKVISDLLLHTMASNKDVEEFLKNSEFSDHQKIALGLGLIPLELYKDLKMIAKIRNKFAHDITITNFDQSPITDFVRELTAPQKFGNLQGEPVPTNSGVFAKTLKDLSNKMQYICAIVGASTTIQHIQNETKKLEISSRFYIDPTR
jgi:DNA-binding MltR family transcriptional regulator